MRLPFVARAEYDRVCTENDRLHTLLKLAVRRKKKTSERPAFSPTMVAAPAISTGIQWEIERRSGGDPFLRRYLHKYAQEQTALNRTADEIMEAIRNGDGEEAED